MVLKWVLLVEKCKRVNRRGGGGRNIRKNDGGWYVPTTKTSSRR